MRPATETSDSRMFLRAKTESPRPTNFLARDVTDLIGLATGLAIGLIGEPTEAAETVGVLIGAVAGFAVTLLVLATLALTSRF